MRLRSWFLVALACCAAWTHAGIPAFTLIEGQIDFAKGPDGNSIVFEGDQGLVVIDTGRHPEHTDKLLAYAKNVGKPITTIINTHWHLDHSTGNGRILAVYPKANVYASMAVEGALKGFLVKNIDQTRALLNDPSVPDERKAAIRRFLNVIDHPETIIPNVPVNGSTNIRLGDRVLELRLAKRAATEGDVWVFDRANKTVFVGDLVVVPIPFFDTACAQGWQKALAEVEREPFETLVPGHGKPMNRATFSTYKQAFSRFVDCAESSAPTAECVAIWNKEGAAFMQGMPNVKELDEGLQYYVNEVIRSKHKRKEYCGN